MPSKTDVGAPDTFCPKKPCPRCGAGMRLIDWEGSQFYGCNRNPRCKQTLTKERAEEIWANPDIYSMFPLGKDNPLLECTTASCPGSLVIRFSGGLIELLPGEEITPLDTMFLGCTEFNNPNKRCRCTREFPRPKRPPPKRTPKAPAPEDDPFGSGLCSDCFAPLIPAQGGAPKFNNGAWAWVKCSNPNCYNNEFEDSKQCFLIAQSEIIRRCPLCGGELEVTMVKISGGQQIPVYACKNTSKFCCFAVFIQDPQNTLWDILSPM